MNEILNKGIFKDYIFPQRAKVVVDTVNEPKEFISSVRVDTEASGKFGQDGSQHQAAFLVTYNWSADSGLWGISTATSGMVSRTP